MTQPHFLLTGSVPIDGTSTVPSARTLDTDTTLAANSDDKVPSQKAIKSYAQPLDSDLTAIAALSTAAFGRSLLTGADAAAVKTLLALAKADVGLDNVTNNVQLIKQTDLLGTVWPIGGFPIAGAVSQAYGANNRAYIVPIQIGQKSTITGLRYKVGATATGNTRVALYNSAGTRVIDRTTNWTPSGTQTIDSVPFDAPVVLEPGLYWALLKNDTSTSTFIGWAIGNWEGPSTTTDVGAAATPSTITPPAGTSQASGVVPVVSVY